MSRHPSSYAYDGHENQEFVASEPPEESPEALMRKLQKPPEVKVSETPAEALNEEANEEGADDSQRGFVIQVPGGDSSRLHESFPSDGMLSRLKQTVDLLDESERQLMVGGEATAENYWGKE
eukprot:TRINITY_DN84216_c0_g1_i1.p1 TRINITY_DN84216_c0_g1~~TRINITY_DN84216_c0_g1_i1.p1  ORF type:complete len:138 (+),score=38.12 TRINITY_DN84216_c0_g1_i1:50-415(+)